MQTPEGLGTSSVIIRIFVVHTVVWICMYRRCLNVCLCVTGTFIFGHVAFFFPPPPASDLHKGFWLFFFFFFPCWAKKKEGVFHALCNLFLWAQIKLSQSRLIYYRSSCLFLSRLARKWTLTSPAQQLTQHSDVVHSSAGITFTLLLSFSAIR